MQLQEMKGQLRSRDQRALELQVETEQLQEQAARQNAVIASLKKRIQVYCYHICNVLYICHIKISIFSFSLFVHPLGHKCSIGRVNYILQFIYYKTQLIMYGHPPNII